MDKEKLFQDFLAEYFENIMKELPQSYRAQQLRAGGVPARMVYDFETRFLKEPFLKAIKKVKSDGD